MMGSDTSSLITKESLVVLIFPLFARVFAVHICVLASEVGLLNWNDVHVPDSYKEIFEFNFSFELSVEEVVIF